jgi:hypothetical protein
MTTTETFLFFFLCRFFLSLAVELELALDSRIVRLGSSDVVRDFFVSLSSVSLLLAERALLLFCWRTLGPGLEERVPEDMVVLGKTQGA